MASQALLFGRGRLAGVDDGMMERRGRGGVAAAAAEAAAAAAAGDSERDEKSASHWSRKPRGEMTERDWRIFREDFSIAYKGAGWMGGSGARTRSLCPAASAPAPAPPAAAAAAPQAQRWPLPPSPPPSSRSETGSEASLPDPLLRAVQAAGYDRPSPIQMAAIPLGWRSATSSASPRPVQRQDRRLSLCRCFRTA